MPPKEKQTTSSKKRPKMAAAAEEPKISAKKPKADEISAIAKKLEEEEAQYIEGMDNCLRNASPKDREHENPYLRHGRYGGSRRLLGPVH